MRVMVAMSGGVDSSMAAALLVDAGHEVSGVTLKLWGGESDRGCCSVSDVDDARRVADHLGIDHHTFGFADEFTRHVVEPYVAAHRDGITPNPCIECNRHVKFDRLLRRALALGFDAVATGHHARIVTAPDGARRVARGADANKDQSYVLYMLGADQLSRILLPIGGMTKSEVRRHAEARGMRIAAKPDSQDVCFITAAQGRRTFLANRIPLRSGRVVDTAGEELGHVDAVELVTVGQRKGLGLAGAGRPRYVLAVDPECATVTVGSADELLDPGVLLAEPAWAATPPPAGLVVEAQTSAHGTPRTATVIAATAEGVELRWATPQKRVAQGQSVVLYAGEVVLGGGLAVAPASAGGDSVIGGSLQHRTG